MFQNTTFQCLCSVFQVAKPRRSLYNTFNLLLHLIFFIINFLFTLMCGNKKRKEKERPWSIPLDRTYGISHWNVNDYCAITKTQFHTRLPCIQIAISESV